MAWKWTREVCGTMSYQVQWAKIKEPPTEGPPPVCTGAFLARTGQNHGRVSSKNVIPLVFPLLWYDLLWCFWVQCIIKTSPLLGEELLESKSQKHFLIKLAWHILIHSSNWFSIARWQNHPKLSGLGQHTFIISVSLGQPSTHVFSAQESSQAEIKTLAGVGSQISPGIYRWLTFPRSFIGKRSLVVDRIPCLLPCWRHFQLLQAAFGVFAPCSPHPTLGSSQHSRTSPFTEG